jgi:hypothetical protein
MDRYWISREIHGKNKVVIPSAGDLEKYSRQDEKNRNDGFLEEKAEICGRIVKLFHPDCSVNDMVRRSARLMAKDYFDLKKILDAKLAEQRAQKK